MFSFFNRKKAPAPAAPVSIRDATKRVRHFEKFQDVTAGTAESAIIGSCGLGGGEVIKCVRKVFSDEEFTPVINNIDKHRIIIEKFGPSIISIDRENNTIFTEFIPNSSTVNEFLTDQINPWEKSGFSQLKTIVNKIGTTLKQLHETGFCHNDVNLGNFLINDIDNLDVRLIDFDTISEIEGCGDLTQIREALEDGLTDNIINRQRLDANRSNDHIYEAQTNSIKRILKAADKQRLIFK